MSAYITTKSLALMLLLASCSGNSGELNGKISQKSAAADAQITVPTPSDSDAVPVIPATPTPSPIENNSTLHPENESVLIPSQINGGYLHCEEIVDPEFVATKRKVGCSLRSEVDNSKIDLAADYMSRQWSFISVAPITATIVELPVTSPFHVRYDLSATRPELFNGAKQVMSFKLVVQQKNNVSTPYIADLSTRFAKWVVRNGAAIQGSDVALGSEQKGSISLKACRIHYNNQIIPGKLTWNSSNDKTKSVCFAALDGMEIRSNEDGTGRLLYPSDVLQIESLKFDDLFQWVTANNGEVPTLAYRGGIDSKGRSLYLCQALENSVGVTLVSSQAANDPAGEYTPGQIRAGDKGCSYNYYGQRTRSSYRVLSWRSEALKALMHDAEDLELKK